MQDQSAPALAIIVCGGRTYDDRDAVYRTLARLDPALVIHGGASGADALADAWCCMSGTTVARVPAMWNKHGKGAGPKRNRAMLHLLKAVGHTYSMRIAVVAFPGGDGTRNMKRIASQNKVDVIEAPGASVLLEVGCAH